MLGIWIFLKKLFYVSLWEYPYIPWINKKSPVAKRQNTMKAYFLGSEINCSELRECDLFCVDKFESSKY